MNAVTIEGQVWSIGPKGKRLSMFVYVEVKGKRYPLPVPVEATGKVAYMTLMTIDARKVNDYRVKVVGKLDQNNHGFYVLADEIEVIK